MAKKKKDDVAILSVKKAKDELDDFIDTSDEDFSTEEESDIVTKKEVIPLWEGKWNKEALLEKRLSMGSREFDRGYRQRAMSDDDLLFKPETIDKALDRQLTIPESIEKNSLWWKFPRDAGVDLAIAKESKEADYFSLTGICTTKDWHRYLMQFYMLKGINFGQQASFIAESFDRFGYSIITVENNGYQEALVRHFEEESIYARVPVTGFRTGRLQKVDVEVGVPGMAVEFEQGRWHIPYGDARSRRIVEPLIEQLRIYPNPGSHDDGVMSTFFARESRRLGERVAPRIRIIRW